MTLISVLHYLANLLNDDALAAMNWFAGSSSFGVLITLSLYRESMNRKKPSGTLLGKLHLATSKSDSLTVLCRMRGPSDQCHIFMVGRQYFLKIFSEKITKKWPVGPEKSGSKLLDHTIVSYGEAFSGIG